MGIKITKNLNGPEISAKVKAGAELYGNTVAAKFEGHAKQNAPWTDRTTAARNSIQGKFKWIGDKAVVEISGNVWYFVYLELAMEKRYAILVPTIQRLGKEAVEGYRSIFK